MKTIITAIILTLLLGPVGAFAGQVDINAANAEAISAELKGIGLSKAKAIVAYREKHGPFQSAEDLSLVKGIGERTVEINRANIKVGGARKK